MKSLDDFRIEVNADQDTVTGEINSGVVDNIIWDEELRLRNGFRKFSEVASNIYLTLYVLSPDEIERCVLDQRLHVGIAPVMHEVAGLTYTYLFDEVNNLYCDRGHSLFDRPDSDITTADLIKSQYLKIGYAVNSNLQQANAAMGKRVVGFHVEALALLILSGCYIGCLPEHYASVGESAGEMCRLLPKRYAAVVSFASMTARGRPHTKAQHVFLASLHRGVQVESAGAAARARVDRGKITGIEQSA